METLTASKTVSVQSDPLDEVALPKKPSDQAPEFQRHSPHNLKVVYPDFDPDDRTPPRRRGGRKSALPLGQFVYLGHRFCSRCEAACGALFEKYIPEFRVQDGKTFQVPIAADSYGNMRSVDFLVAGVLLEFHPPRMWRNTRRCGDFKNYDEYLKFRKAMNCLRGEARREFRQETLEQLKENYYEKRRKTIDQNPMLKKLELVVATSAGEVYDRIIAKVSPNVPAREDFIREFQSILSRVEDRSPQSQRHFRKSHTPARSAYRSDDRHYYRRSA